MAELVKHGDTCTECKGRVKGRMNVRVTAYDGQGRADSAFRRERPVHTARLCVERVHGAVLAPDVEATSRNRRLRPGGGRIGEPERPLEREPRDIGGTQPSLVGWLVSRVGG